MKKTLALLSLVAVFSLTNLFAVTVSDDTVNGVERYAIYIGSNYGGKGREKLLYAGSDAQSFKNAMAEIGGVAENNSRILIDPTKESVDKALKEISNTINSKTGQTKRSEFIFYYSGHSDENALLLGDVKYDYSTLKSAITEVPSDIHVVILDSCYSGNFIRTKGGQKRKPFLIDDSSVVTGHAYLSSSSDNESSQESDEIESSYFTNAMITGLRGAADTSGDNKVTLNELYSYAFSDTLSKTESSKAGPQHPNYNITLVGSGDLVLSDLSTADSMLSLSKEAKGRFIIRDANDKLISEINKTEGQPIFIALPVGQYSALIIDEYSTKQGTFLLEKDQVYVLDQNTLNSIKRKSNRLRGGEEEAEPVIERQFTDDDEETLDIDGLEDSKTLRIERTFNDKDYSDYEEIEYHPDFSEFYGVNVELVPGVNFYNEKTDTVNFACGIFGNLSNNIIGAQVSDLFNISTGSVLGAQISGLFNITSDYNQGLQISGLFNHSRNVSGSQITGLYNIAFKNVNGFQISGIHNITKDLKGAQASGVFNLAKNADGIQITGVGNVADTINGAQISGLFNIANEISGVQIGVFNYSKKNNGITIGLFNYVEDGLGDFCYSINSNGMMDFYYQGGSRNLYTILGGGNAFHYDDWGYVYLGIGTQFQIGHRNANTTRYTTSFELEYLFKMYYFDPDIYEDQIIQTKNLNTMDKINSITVHSARINWNCFQSKHVSLFITLGFDFFKDGFNDIAKEFGTKNVVFDADDVHISTNIGIGAKLHF